jgi:hypothetical protein
MASISLPQFLWLLFIITTVSATQQFALGYDDAISNCPYTCGGEANATGPTAPACCFYKNPCSGNLGCGGSGASLINATDTSELVGTVNIVLGNDDVVPIKALASLGTKRNYITSTLVNFLGLDDAVEKLAGVDVHLIDIFGCNITISTFVLVSVGIGIDNYVLNDKIFEIIPERESPDKDIQIPDLVLSLNFLQDARALAINQAIFIAEL